MNLEHINISKIKAYVAIAAAVVMYFTPNEVDNIIECLLAAFGISTLLN